MRTSYEELSSSPYSWNTTTTWFLQHGFTRLLVPKIKTNINKGCAYIVVKHEEGLWFTSVPARGHHAFHTEIGCSHEKKMKILNYHTTRVLSRIGWNFWCDGVPRNKNAIKPNHEILLVLAIPAATVQILAGNRLLIKDVQRARAETAFLPKQIREHNARMRLYWNKHH